MTLNCCAELVLDNPEGVILSLSAVNVPFGAVVALGVTTRGVPISDFP